MLKQRTIKCHKPLNISVEIQLTLVRYAQSEYLKARYKLGGK